MKISNEIRQRIVTAYENGHSKPEIAKVLGVKLPAVYAIIKIFVEENRIEKKLKGGSRNRKLGPEQIQSIQNWIDDDCSITLKVIKSRILSTYDINVSLMTIGRYITAFNYTIKSTKLIPQRRNDDRSIDDREEYALAYFRMLTNIDDSKVYFIDEVGFNISMRSSKGRSLRGTNAIKIVPGLRSRNISICCCISKIGIATCKMQKSPFNTDSFVDYIKSLLEWIGREKPGKSVLIMDNVPFHKNSGIRTMIEVKGHDLLYLPPYSPFLNPIENMFSKWKQAVRQQAVENEASLFEIINNVDRIVTSDDCAAYYRHMLSYLPTCIARKAITD